MTKVSNGIPETEACRHRPDGSILQIQDQTQFPFPHLTGHKRVRFASPLQRVPATFSFRSALSGANRDTCFRPVIFGFLRPVFREIPERKRELAYSDLRQSLVHGCHTRSSWLRPLRSSRLSPSVNTTMSRSDSSITPTPWLMPWLAGSGSLVVGLLPEQTRSPSVTIITLPNIPAPNTWRVSCAGLHWNPSIGPPAPPNRVHFRSGLLFGLDPSPDTSRWMAVFAYGRDYFFTSHRSFRRDFNPLVMSAARRTDSRFRGNDVCLRQYDRTISAS